ncbi:MAG TPA: hypothetical protein VD905_02975 [Flavobacteriales bacterium]|nr:hypothetical protein [Flavobacteriales bacterium]
MYNQKISVFKNLAFILFISTAFVCCRANPDDLAKDYCNCRLEIEKGTKSEEDCKNMAESHTLKLQDEEGAFEKYSEKVLDCLSNSKMIEMK